MQKPLISLVALLAAAQPALAQAPAAQPVHVRGTIVSSSARSILVNTGSETETIAFGQHIRLVGVVNSSLDKITTGDFIGTTVARQSDGSLKALEVHIFPAALKGSGEGYRPWDKQQKSMMANATVRSIEQPHNMMANATVQRVGSGAAGRTVVLAYKGGTKTVTIPPDVPVVTFEPGTKSLLANGAHVFVIATRTADGLVARAINVGENGVVPPM
jgi:type IV secretory pathway TrbL component